MSIRRACLSLGALAGAATLVTACGSSDSGAPAGHLDGGGAGGAGADAGGGDGGISSLVVMTTNSVTLFPTTKVLDAASLALLTTASADLTSMAFSGTTPLLSGLQPMDVLMGAATKAAPKGILCRVSQVTPSGSGLALTTTSATLFDAIQGGEYAGSVTLTAQPNLAPALMPGVTAMSVPLSNTPGGLQLLDLPSGGSMSYDLNFGFNEQVYQDSAGRTATLGGNVGLSVKAGFDLNFSTLTAEVFAQGDEEGTIDLKGDQGLTFSKQIPLGSIPLVPVPLPPFVTPAEAIENLGFPLTLVPTLGFVAGAQGTFDQAVETSATETGTLNVGAGIHDSLPIITTGGTANGSFTPPNVPGALDIKAYVGVQASATIFGAFIPAVGANLEVDGFAHLGSDPTGKACWETDVGVETTVVINFLDIPAVTIGPKPVIDAPLSTGSCPASPPLSFAETFAGFAQPTVTGLAPASNAGSYLTLKIGGGTAFVHTNDSGAVDWQAADTATQYVTTLVESPTDGMVAGGQSNGLPWLMSLDSAGTTLWSNAFTASGPTNIAALTYTSDGNLVAVGDFLDAQSTGHLWAAEFDAGGNVVWSNTYDAGTPHAVTATTDGGVVIAGEFSGTTNAQGFVLRLGGDGTVTWKNSVGDGRLFDVTAVVAGGFAAAGATADGYGWLTAFGDDGSVTWSREYYDGTTGTSGLNHSAFAIADVGDGLLVTGEAGTNSAGDLWVFKTASADQSIVFSRTFGGALEDVGRQLIPLADGSFQVAGDTYSLGTDVQPLLLVAPHDGNLTFSATSGITATNVSGSFVVRDGTDVGPIMVTPAPLALTQAAAPPAFNGTSATATTLGP